MCGITYLSCLIEDCICLRSIVARLQINPEFSQSTFRNMLKKWYPFAKWHQTQVKLLFPDVQPFINLLLILTEKYSGV